MALVSAANVMEIAAMAIHTPVSAGLGRGCSRTGRSAAVGGAGGGVATVVTAPSSSCPRSEEHTSELQSRFDLVCRLLLEKKNKYSFYSIYFQKNINATTTLLFTYYI